MYAVLKVAYAIGATIPTVILLEEQSMEDAILSFLESERKKSGLYIHRDPTMEEFIDARVNTNLINEDWILLKKEDKSYRYIDPAIMPIRFCKVFDSWTLEPFYDEFRGFVGGADRTLHETGEHYLRSCFDRSSLRFNRKRLRADRSSIVESLFHWRGEVEE